MRFTYLLIGIMVVIFIFEAILSLQSSAAFDQLFNDYGFSLQGITELKVWTFFTSIFLHADAEHLVLNMIALFFFGRVVEEALGWKKYLMVFITSGVVGNFAVMLSSLVGIMPAAIPTIGASGAIFGVLGAAMILKPFDLVFYPYLIPVPVIMVALLYAIFNIAEFFISAAYGVSQIAYVAHIGGLGSGLMFGFKEEGWKKGLLALVLIFIVLAALPLVWSLLQYLEITNYISYISQIFKL